MEGKRLTRGIARSLVGSVLLCTGGAASAQTGQYSNPRLNVSGDPHAIVTNDRYVVYLPTTCGTDEHKCYKAYQTPDWLQRIDPASGVEIFSAANIPNLKSVGLWAPNVYYDKSTTKYYLYFTNVVDNGQPGEDGDPGIKTIGVATSMSPNGPFTFQRILVGGQESKDGTAVPGSPATIPDNEKGANIDPQIFKDSDGSLWLIYKERTSYGTGTRIKALTMRDPENRNNRQGTGKTLLRGVAGTWEQGLIEQPYLYEKANRYYLFYSAASGKDESYAIGVARSSTKLAAQSGDYVRQGSGPLMKSDPEGTPNRVVAPGSTSIVEDGNDAPWMVYRQKRTAEVTWDNRFVAIDPLTFDADGTVRITPTRGVTKNAPAPLNP